MNYWEMFLKLLNSAMALAQPEGEELDRVRKELYIAFDALDPFDEDELMDECELTVGEAIRTRGLLDLIKQSRKEEQGERGLCEIFVVTAANNLYDEMF